MRSMGEVSSDCHVEPRSLISGIVVSGKATASKLSTGVNNALRPCRG